MLEKKLDKLPLTKAYLAKMKETEEDFRIRKVKCGIERMNTEGEQIKKWKVLREAGIRMEFYNEVKGLF